MSDTDTNGKRRKRRKLSVLVVEDDDNDKELISRLLLRSLRFECAVRHVRKMAAAIDLVNKSRFDIVILDLKLIDSDPDDTIKRLAFIPYRIPTIVVSGGISEEKIADAIAMGADACLDKNRMSVLGICDAIRDAMSRRAARLEAANFPQQLQQLREMIDEEKS